MKQGEMLKQETGPGETGAVRETLRLTAPTFGARFPWLLGIANHPVEDLDAGLYSAIPNRLRNVLGRSAISTCGELAALTDTDILDVRHAGVGTLDLLMTLLESVGAQRDGDEGLDSSAVVAASQGHSAPEVEPTVAPTWDLLESIREPLDVLTEWARFCKVDPTIGGIMDSLADTATIPDDVRDALEAVRSSVVSDRASVPRSRLVTWLEALGPRERDIVRHRLAWRDHKLDELGMSHNVSRERIRQLEGQLRQQLTSQLETDDWREVRWSIAQLTAEVGSWARLHRLPRAAPDTEEWRLIVLLADLSFGAENTTLHRSGFRLPTMDDLQFTAPEGVILDLEHARHTLASIGVREIFEEDALKAIGVHNLDGVWVRWPRSSHVRSIGLLAAHGEPMTAEELAERAGSGSVRSLRQRLQDDPRIQRVTRGTLGLRSWGLPEYTGVADLMLKIIADRGGVVPLGDLTTHLEDVYQVKPSTVLAYSIAPAFVVEDSTIRARGRSEPYPVRTDPAGVPGLSVTADGHIQYELEVERELLRGSGRPTPTALGGLMGLQPGRVLEFETRGNADQPVVILTWSRTSHVGPHIGSLRALALMHGAAEGDRLRLTFDPETLTVGHKLVRQNKLYRH